MRPEGARQRGETRTRQDVARFASTTLEQRAKIQADFCRELAANGGVVTRAVKCVKVSHPQIYAWRKEDPEFAKAWAAAIDIGADVLEQEVHRRAVEGADVPVIYQGEITAWYKQASDTLLMFLLKARRPQFRESFEVSGPNGGPIQYSKVERVLVRPGEVPVVIEGVVEQVASRRSALPEPEPVTANGESE